MFTAEIAAAEAARPIRPDGDGGHAAVTVR
jgi:hypothetical protein